MARKLKVTLVRSPIHRTESQKETIKGLGLRKLNHSRVLQDTPSIRGMIRKVQHLLCVDTADTLATILQDEESQQSADHEIGHYTMANLLNLSFFCHWITIESSPVKDSDWTAGGSVGIGFWHKPNLEQWGDYLYGGMAAQILGVFDRNPSMDTDAALQRVLAMGANDQKLFMEQGGVNGQDRLLRVMKMIGPYFLGSLKVLSAELKEHRVLYCGEEELIILERLYRKPEFKGVLARYRRTRKTAPPADGNDFKDKHPNITWREPVIDWILRTNQPMELYRAIDERLRRRERKDPPLPKG